jgi:hypothetical protein
MTPPPSKNGTAPLPALASPSGTSVGVATGMTVGEAAGIVVNDAMGVAVCGIASRVADAPGVTFNPTVGVTTARVPVSTAVPPSVARVVGKTTVAVGEGTLVELG